MDTAELETLIVRTARGDATRDELLTALLASKVAILLDKGLEGDALANDARPLTLRADQGFPVLAVFSSVEKTKPWVQREPVYAHALYTDFDWALRIIPPRFGLAVNPGYQSSFLMAPDDVLTHRGPTG